MASNHGARSITQVTFPAGATALEHYHTEYRETFKVHQGELTVMKDGKKYLVNAGQLSPTIKVYEIHTYKNNTKENVVVDIILEPGHRGCELANIIFSGIVKENKLGEVSTHKGYNLFWVVFYEITNTIPIGIPGFSYSALKFFYGRKRIDAYKKNLIDRYITGNDS
jgi:mannose-6-phosphate isomerase-like protein (cupin superfamily)